MLRLNERMIKEGCVRSRTFQDGKEYYYQGAVTSLELDAEDRAFYGEVEGSFVYDVEIAYNEKGDLHYTDCDCPAHEKYPGFCKHIVAVLFQIMETNYKRNAPLLEDTADVNWQVAREMLSLLDYGRQSQGEEELQLDITLHVRSYELGISMKIGGDRLYVLKDFNEFFAAIDSQEPLYYGKQFTFDPSRHCFKEGDQALIDLAREVHSLDSFMGKYSFGRNRLVDKKEVVLPNKMLPRVLELLRNRPFNLDLGNQYLTDVYLVDEDLPINFDVENSNGNLALAINLPDRILNLTSDFRYVYYQGKVHKLSQTQARALLPVAHGLKYSEDNRIVLPRHYREQFVSVMLPALKKAGQVKIDQELEDEFYHQPLLVRLWMDGSPQHISLKVEFAYGEYNINPFSNVQPDTGDRILVRDVDGEIQVMDKLEESGFTVRGDGLYIEDEELIYDFFSQVLPQLQKQGEIFYSERLGRGAIVSRPYPRGRVSMTAGNLLEVDFELEGVSQEELADVLMSLKEKRRYHRLRDGSLLSLEEDQLDNLAGMLDELDLKKGDLAKGKVEVPAYRAMTLDHFLRDDSLKSIKRDHSFRDLVARVLDADEVEYTLPENLEPILRDYQRRGFRWLKTLTACNMGGILADEMGLGKTLQVITLLQSELPLQHPALVVAPTSLQYNWQAEIQRFAPGLRVGLIVGTKEERIQQLQDLANYDVVITSYALIRRDFQEYKGLNFSWCILDEAQYIKNPVSVTAKAVKSINSAKRLALTGTPIENSLTELWSVFDFLMPGFLGAHRRFTQKYVKPIEQDGDTDLARDLARRVSPFVLRRLKKDVLKELPPKIEHKMLSELTTEQKKIYMAWLERIRGEAAASLAQEGFDKSRVKILAGLTRLRQICCHPSLFLENFHGESGKLNQLKEVAVDSVASGHRILIFSQFTTMLELIRQELTNDGLDCFYLDGSTPAQKRLEMVRAFNRGENNVFLISLKAGGTGLNLTGADTVIHFDLWWNPAVEDQASDRAHRIGQTKRVQVMKFVSMGTIDEKIYELQQKKKELIDKVIDPGETLLTSLSEEELRNILDI